ncbi:hypothetical protein PVAP13_8NG240201 [Panicum virgatum]|uniref:Uncharacterized protein n=1 Tax=Panicum virgatum TaxID=38727 RepID=A0A8T0P9C8_PANVG|nr:hypothetical protein PVAP13_8NG240201 [Panicum virgatum]
MCPFVTPYKIASDHLSLMHTSYAFLQYGWRKHAQYIGTRASKVFRSVE